MLASLVAAHTALASPFGLRRATPAPLRSRGTLLGLEDVRASLLAEVAAVKFEIEPLASGSSRAFDGHITRARRDIEHGQWAVRSPSEIRHSHPWTSPRRSDTVQTSKSHQGRSVLGCRQIGVIHEFGSQVSFHEVSV